MFGRRISVRLDEERAQNVPMGTFETVTGADCEATNRDFDWVFRCLGMQPGSITRLTTL